MIQTAITNIVYHILNIGEFHGICCLGVCDILILYCFHCFFYYCLKQFCIAANDIDDFNFIGGHNCVIPAHNNNIPIWCIAWYGRVQYEFGESPTYRGIRCRVRLCTCQIETRMHSDARIIRTHSYNWNIFPCSIAWHGRGQYCCGESPTAQGIRCRVYLCACQSSVFLGVLPIKVNEKRRVTQPYNQPIKQINKQSSKHTLTQKIILSCISSWIISTV